MAFFILLVIMFWIIALVSKLGTTSTVLRCHSLTCSHNRRGRCTKGTIIVYDNTVKGLCFNHTESMRKRVIDPMVRKGWTIKPLKSSPTETLIAPVKNFNPWTSRKEKLDWWLN